MKALLKNLKNVIFTNKNYNNNNFQYPDNFVKPFLHIGCGDINLDGWINLDARNKGHIHIHTDNLDLSQFSDESLGVIYLSHVLEHVSFVDAEILINTFFKKLRKGGVLLVSVPDFEAMIKIYQGSGSDLNIIRKALLGGQDYEYNYHKSVYDNKLLCELCLNSGFNIASKYSTLEEFGSTVGDFSTYEINSIPVSINIKAIKL
jgi:predicted SAM-dependent methyltransferase